MDAERDLVEVVAAVIRLDDRVLACRRRPGKAAAGFWEFPGGKVSDGESPESALRREIQEELATDVVVGDLLIASDAPEAGIRLSCFWATVVGPMPVASTDHDELRWVTADELDSVQWAAPDLGAVALVKHLLG